ncbi:DMT family transporter [Bacillus massiliglaciei]|uniref:DMT family transporter n=1 Tax=Bacillus massiliglaciei TaxID=1816693 RepID=UPI000B1BA2F3|nr:DMT family transporter [Bacillus massiliglaciei]
MRKTADLTLLSVSLVWGATFVTVQNAIAFLEPMSFNAIRFFIAFLLLLLIHLCFFRKEKRTNSWKLFAAGFKIGIWLYLGYTFQTIGLEYTTPSKAGFITGLSVVLVPVFSMVFLKNRLTKNTVIGVTAAIIGLYLMTVSGKTAVNIGDFLVFLCAVSFAMQIITTAKYAAEFKALPLTIVQLLTVSLLSAGSGLIWEDFTAVFKADIIFQSDVISGLLITSVLATAFAFLAQTYFQAYTTPSRVAIIFAMEPVFAAITSYIWIGEVMTVQAVIGCTFILFGMLAAELPSRKEINKKTEFS